MYVVAHKKVKQKRWLQGNVSKKLCLYVCIYLFVFAGTSIIDPDVYLVGASGGVYALLAAHLANVMINYHQMRYGVLRLAAILFFGKFIFDFLFYIIFWWCSIQKPFS